MIGCGSVTERKSAPAFAQVNGFELLQVTGRDPERVRDYARRHQVPSWTVDASALINNPQIDAVYIATPPDSHLSYALQVADAGKICCVEKPMALDYRQCLQMVAAFEDAERALFVSYYRRSLPRFVAIHDWLRAGLIGALRHVHWDYCRPPGQHDLEGTLNWRTQPERAGGGYFVDLASHGLDLLLYWFGEVEQIRGLQMNQQGLYAAADAVTACWTFASGATGSGYWNFGSAMRLDRLCLHGSTGRIECAVFADEPIHLLRPDRSISLEIAHPDPIQLPHIEAMRAHLSGGPIHPSTGREAMRVTAFMDQILAREHSPHA
jgi:predicted dehydrogenase